MAVLAVGLLLTALYVSLLYSVNVNPLPIISTVPAVNKLKRTSDSAT